MTADPGVELPAYLPLPVVDGGLAVDRLEAWQVETSRRATELCSALMLVDAGAVPAGDHDVIVDRIGEFRRRRDHDMAWAFGWLIGRGESMRTTFTGGDQLLAFETGRAAAMAESRRRMLAAAGGTT